MFRFDQSDADFNTRTTDIGGFHGGNGADPDFRELFVRWFQWGTFCPVMRLHGDREPKQPQLGSGGGSGWYVRSMLLVSRVLISYE